MLFSYKLLSKLVDLSSTDCEAIRKRLTFSGFEVEGIQKMAQASSLVIGKIIQCEKHPDSDHLHCLLVDLGHDLGIKKIVCGAPNAREGIKVIVALPGAVLPAIGETIKPGVIRGQESNGMCCSLVELGVDKELLSPEQINGIEELSADAPVGETDVLGYLGLDDTIFDINVLPNRPDCLSYLGIAREISSLTSLPLAPVPAFDSSAFSQKMDPLSLSDRCSRFDIIRVTDVEPKSDTPEDIKRFLQASGIRPISPIVDLGNYAMLLTGQPFNMYDADKNKEGKYVVKDDYCGDFVSFDDKTYLLKNEDLVVTDGNSPLCLGGIMAGKKACVDASTKNFDIEAAIFYHANIRHTSSRIGLSSPSSQLFAKERNPLMVDEALAVIISYLPKFLEKYTLTGYGSFNSVSTEIKPVSFSLSALNHRLGSQYTEDEVNHVLNSYRIRREGSKLYAPLDRVDLLEQCDIEEEVFRYYGSEKLIPSLDNYPITQGGLTPEQKMKRQIRNLLIDKGFDEMICYTLINEKMDKMIRVFDDGEGYHLINPMTKDHEIVRSDLLPSLLEVADFNIAHSNNNFCLYEISDVDNRKGSHLYLSLAMHGKETLTEGFMERPYSFEDIKGAIEAIFDRLGISKTRYRLAYSKNPAFHPYCSADIIMGRDMVGTFGTLHPNVRKDSIFVAEIDLGYLFSLKGLKSKFQAFNSDTKVRRDLSFGITDSVTYAKLVSTISSVRDTYLDHVEMFDDFVDKATGKEYLGVSLYFSKSGSTLKGEEIDNSLDKIITAVKTSLGLTLRGE
ncbi:MAG: phenylalanine--tRNA ligase subunit beta [Bacilli bacterium]